MDDSGHLNKNFGGCFGHFRTQGPYLWLALLSINRTFTKYNPAR